MSYADRKKIMQEIEGHRSTKVITLVISDRYSTIPWQGIQAQMAADQVSQIVKHLNSIRKGGEIKSIDLFLYSRGGDINTAWPLVNSIRGYCDRFSVLVPVHAHSAATLIALGAEEILMTPMASLSPIDPTVANAFNPKDPNSHQPIGISVEDVTSFVALAKDKERVGIKREDNVTKVFEILARDINPLALGNVKRSHTQIRLLGRKLLGLHLDPITEKKRIDSIVDELTERFSTHFHSIFREEARKSVHLGNLVKNADAKEEQLLWDLYSDYETEMKLKEFFDLNAYLGNDDEKKLETFPVFMESMDHSSRFCIRQNLRRALHPDANIRLQVLGQSAASAKQAQQLKGQLLQIKANVDGTRAPVAQLANQNPTIPIFQQILNDLNQASADVGTLVANVVDTLDLSTLKRQIESDLEFIGWIE